MPKSSAGSALIAPADAPRPSRRCRRRASRRGRGSSTRARRRRSSRRRVALFVVHEHAHRRARQHRLQHHPAQGADVGDAGFAADRARQAADAEHFFRRRCVRRGSRRRVGDAVLARAPPTAFAAGCTTFPTASAACARRRTRRRSRRRTSCRAAPPGSRSPLRRSCASGMGDRRSARRSSRRPRGCARRWECPCRCRPSG